MNIFQANEIPQTVNTPRDYATSAETIKKAIDDIRSLAMKDQWLLIDPNSGTMFEGNTEGILRILLQNHPIYKHILTCGTGKKPEKENESI